MCRKHIVKLAIYPLTSKSRHFHCEILEGLRGSPEDSLLLLVKNANENAFASLP